MANGHAHSNEGMGVCRNPQSQKANFFLLAHSTIGNHGNVQKSVEENTRLYVRIRKREENRIK